MRPYTESELEYITHNRWTGILTRETFDVELTYIDPTGLALVVWDIDNLKEHNNRHGKLVSTTKMRNGARCSNVEMTAHLWSGDEYASICRMQDAIGLANRVQAGLHIEGMSATFVILECFSAADVARYLLEMDDLINYIKQAGHRGTITDYREVV